MANRRLTPETMAASGLTATVISDLLVADTHQVRNNGKMFLRMAKTGAGNAVFTITTPITTGGYAVADETVTVLATTGKQFIGPFAPGIFNNSVGDLEFTVDDVVGLECEVLQL